MPLRYVLQKIGSVYICYMPVRKDYVIEKRLTFCPICKVAVNQKRLVKKEHLLLHLHQHIFDCKLSEKVKTEWMRKRSKYKLFSRIEEKHQEKNDGLDRELCYQAILKGGPCMRKTKNVICNNSNDHSLRLGISLLNIDI